MCMYACMDIKVRGDLGPCSPMKIRCSEIASEAFLGQKQSHSSIAV